MPSLLDWLIYPLLSGRRSIADFARAAWPRMCLNRIRGHSAPHAAMLDQSALHTGKLFISRSISMSRDAFCTILLATVFRKVTNKLNVTILMSKTTASAALSYEAIH